MEIHAYFCVFRKNKYCVRCWILTHNLVLSFLIFVVAVLSACYCTENVSTTPLLLCNQSIQFGKQTLEVTKQPGNKLASRYMHRIRPLVALCSPNGLLGNL